MTIDLDMLSEEVLAAAALPMPFGRFKGTPLLDLPEPYVVWFKQQGYPSGHLGRQMALIYEIKANGLEKLLRPVLAARKHEASETQELPDNASSEKALPNVIPDE